MDAPSGTRQRNRAWLLSLSPETSVPGGAATRVSRRWLVAFAAAGGVVLGSALVYVELTRPTAAECAAEHAPDVAEAVAQLDRLVEGPLPDRVTTTTPCGDGQTEVSASVILTGPAASTGSR